MGDLGDEYLELVFITIGILLTITFLSCLVVICMKLREYEMKKYLMNLARRKGLKLDPDKLSAKPCQSPLANENCTIYIPDVGIIL